MPSCLCQIVPKEEENVYMSTSNCHKRRRKKSTSVCLVVLKIRKKSTCVRLIVTKEEGKSLSMHNCHKRRRKMSPSLCLTVPKEEESCGLVYIRLIVQI